MAITPPDGDPEKKRLPWRDDAAAGTGGAKRATATGSGGMRWFLSLLILALVASGSFVLGRGSDPGPPATAPVAVSPPPVMPLAQESLPAMETGPVPAEIPSVTPPALARVAEQPKAVPGSKTAVVKSGDQEPAGGLHLSGDQIAAVRQIARDAEANVASRPAPMPRPPKLTRGPRVGPSGQVVQLGSYGSAREAAAAAAVFRYKYRGLLEQLPQGAVLPYKPKGTKRTFYRVQFVTPSQAYSEVTCQRLRAADKTCIVIY